MVLAHRSDAIRPALRRWRPVLAFAIIEMAIPWILLAIAEQHLASGLTGLIIATVPIVGAISAFCLGDRSALRRARVFGIFVGFAGVAFLVGNDLRGDGAPPWWSIAMVLVVCVCYGTAPFIIERKLSDVPAIGVIALSLGAVALLYAPIAGVSATSNHPSLKSVSAVVVLALVCTGLAFVVFFKLLDEIGPARAPLITFANPVVAVAFGAVLLDEAVTVATLVGFVLVMTGCWLATRPAPVVVRESPTSAQMVAAAID
jgi:drug/metabolite transporter (DMT)-like permease